MRGQGRSITRLGLALFLCPFAASRAADAVVAHWTFDGGDSRPAVGASTNVPDAFIYDPLTGRSRANAASAALGDGVILPVEFAKALPAGRSVTIEAFVKAAPGFRGDAWIAGKSRASDTGSELSIELHHLRQHGQTWHGAAFARPGARPVRFTAGHYSSATRLSAESDTWRHVAVVYDAAAGTMTCWVDYHLSRAEATDGPLAWDDGPFRLGGRAGDGPQAEGFVDEVRVTAAALGPARFLRARADAIEGVSFVSGQRIVPIDAGCYDAKEHFGTAGDGRTDDTVALNAAFAHLASKVPLAYNTLVLPAGTYLVSGMLHCSRFIDVKGAGPERTVIRLRDGTFTDPARPQPVLRMSSTQGDPGSHKAVNGSSISIYLDGVTIDTGRGNPGAKALEYHANNLGRLENVVLRSGDGAGVLGLDLTHHDVGPSLVKNVTVEGFDTGAAIRYAEYSMTFEHVTLRGQRVAGIRNQGNILAVRGLKSDNRVTAMVCEGPTSMLTLLDSDLRGGDAGQPAIWADGGLYALRVKTAGYACAVAKRAFVKGDPVEWAESVVAGPDIGEYVGDGIVTGHGRPAGALKLPVEETPEPAAPLVDDWVNVERFESRKRGEDWAPAVQAAIDSGARVLYTPANATIRFETPVRLHGRIERLHGFGGAFNWSPKVWKEEGRREQADAARAPPPLLIFDEPDPSRIVVIDRLACAHVRHESPATLVLRSSSPGRYTTGAAGGRLFAEDVGGADWHFDHPQRVWVRQWNPESHSAGPCVHSRGATIWALGFKTEYESLKLRAEAGAQTEILGSFVYPIGTIPPDRPVFENRDSRISLVYGISRYAANHRIHIRDTRGSETLEIGNDRLRWAYSRAHMDLYTSDARRDNRPVGSRVDCP